MATVYPTAAGTWSTQTWNDDATGAAYGMAPQAGDTVLANGVAVTIDIDITVAEIATRAGTTASAGGSFAVSGTRTINANIAAGTTDCLTVSTSSSVITLVGNVTGGTSTNADGILYSAASSTLAITGNVTGGSAGTANGIVASASAPSAYSINGNVTGGSSSTARGIQQSGTCAGTIVGNFIGSAGPGLNSSNGTVEVTGNPTNGNSVNVSGGTVTITLTSDVTGIATAGNLIVSGGSCLIDGGGSYSFIGAAIAGRPAMVLTGGVVKAIGSFVADVSVAATLSTNGSLYIVGNVSATTSTNGISYLGGNLVVVGNVTGGTTGDGISSTAPLGACGIVVGTVTGGSSGTGYGINHTGNGDWRIFGTTVAGAGDVAINNTGTGSVTVTAVGGGGGPTSSILAYGQSF
jgi:hypothetical protein